MPRYWVCNRCGSYNLELECDICSLSKIEGQAYEEIADRNPLDEDMEDQEDWLLTSVFEDDENDFWNE